MKTTLKKLTADFEPFELNIKVESKEEAEILFRLVNLSRERSMDVVNGTYSPQAHIKYDAIKLVTDSIYYGLDRRVYEPDSDKIKNLFENIINRDHLINIGDTYACINDVVMDNSGLIEFTKGKIYVCEIARCLTNNSGNREHICVCDDDWQDKHFVKVDTSKVYLNVGNYEPKLPVCEYEWKQQRFAALNKAMKEYYPVCGIPKIWVEEFNKLHTELNKIDSKNVPK